MEIDGQAIVLALPDFHLKHQLGGLGEQRLFQPLEAVGSALFPQSGPLEAAASAHRFTAEILPFQPLLPRLIAQQIEPHGAMLQLFANRLQDPVFVPGFIFYPAHMYPPPLAYTKSPARVLAHGRNPTQ